jgi:hypothetical protein
MNITEGNSTVTESMYSMSRDPSFDFTRKDIYGPGSRRNLGNHTHLGHVHFPGERNMLSVAVIEDERKTRVARKRKPGMLPFENDDFTKPARKRSIAYRKQVLELPMDVSRCHIDR